MRGPDLFFRSAPVAVRDGPGVDRFPERVRACLSRDSGTAPASVVRLILEIPQLEDIIQRALEKDRNLRYQHAGYAAELCAEAWTTDFREGPNAVRATSESFRP